MHRNCAAPLAGYLAVDLAADRPPPCEPDRGGRQRYPVNSSLFQPARAKGLRDNGGPRKSPALRPANSYPLRSRPNASTNCPKSSLPRRPAAAVMSRSASSASDRSNTLSQLSPAASARPARNSAAICSRSWASADGFMWRPPQRQDGRREGQCATVHIHLATRRYVAGAAMFRNADDQAHSGRIRIRRRDHRRWYQRSVRFSPMARRAG